jgi:DNA-directed RNA polymerase II subunit RPB1
VLRLKGKEGRLRGNLMGKRVDFSARTVITGDPNLELDEVGVPKSNIVNLTYPYRNEVYPDLWNFGAYGWGTGTVILYNIVYFQELVQNRPQSYPGARYVVCDTDERDERVDLRYHKRADTFLRYGWVVCEHLKDGE